MLSSVAGLMAMVAVVTAQNATTPTSTMSLSQVLSMNNKTLGTLSSLLAAQPALTSTLAAAKDITILAPSNDAFTKFLAVPANKMASMDTATVAAILQYHVLGQLVPGSAFTTSAQFLPSLLTDSKYTNVTGGQVVMGMLNGKTVEVMSGLKEISKVTTADVAFSGGVIHIIDTVLTVPMSPSMSAIDSSLTSLAGALTKANLVSAVDNLKDVTIFAPSNEAFVKIDSATSALSTMQLANILEYHVINGTVGYSSLLTTGLANESFPTLIGTQVAIEYVDKKVFINSAQVTITDIIVANGVMHVVDNVINPSNATATPVNPTATTQPVAFAGASSIAGAAVPFTSGISATTTAPSASTMTAGAQGSMPSVMGGMGMAALFGMGVVAAVA